MTVSDDVRRPTANSKERKVAGKVAGTAYPEPFEGGFETGHQALKGPATESSNAGRRLPQGLIARR